MAGSNKLDSQPRVHEILKDIYRIPVRLPDSPLKELNSYLIRDPVCSLLIDTGFRHPACREALLAGLDELGVAPGTFDIVLTHCHADHSGLASEIIGDKRRVMVSFIDRMRLENLAALNDNRGREKWVWTKERDTLAGMPSEIVDGSETLNPAIVFAPPIGARYATIGDGETLRAGGYELRCIPTPGHSPGHMCLWDERIGLMFTGDHVLFDITPNITAWTGVEDSLGDYLDSLRMIREYPVKTALPGHRTTGDFHARIEELLKHHDVRLAEVEKITRNEPGLTTYEIAGRMRWKIRAVNWDEFPVTQKFFAVGECQAHLDYLRLRGRMRLECDDRVYRYYRV